MTLLSWRITKTRYVEEAFSGEGAWRFGGRWNSRGHRVVYTAEHASLAVLEVLVHLESSFPLPTYSLIQTEFDESLVELLEENELPQGWRGGSTRTQTQRIGDEWIDTGRSLVLGVPSAVLPIERIYLINPGHPKMTEIIIQDPQTFTFDERLVG